MLYMIKPCTPMKGVLNDFLNCISAVIDWADDIADRIEAVDIEIANIDADCIAMNNKLYISLSLLKW